MPSQHVISLDEHISLFNEILANVDREIEDRCKRRGEGVRFLQKTRKQLKTLKKQVPRVRKNQPSTHQRVSGFGLPCRIDETLRAFLKLDADATPTRHEIRDALSVYIKFNPADKRPKMQRWSYLNPQGERNLQDDTLRSVIHPDSQLSELLNYREYMERVQRGEVKGKRKDPETGQRHEVTIHSEDLTYCVVQQLFQQRILETLPPPKEKEESAADGDESSPEEMPEEGST